MRLSEAAQPTAHLVDRAWREQRVDGVSVDNVVPVHLQQDAIVIVRDGDVGSFVGKLVFRVLCACRCRHSNILPRYPSASSSSSAASAFGT